MMPLTQRLARSTGFYIVVCLLARAIMTRHQWDAVRKRTLRNWKDVSGVLLGLLIAIYAAAALSANTFGLLVKMFPGEYFARSLVVEASKPTGSNFKALELDLLSSEDHQTYEITLSKRIFGDLPAVSCGDVIFVEGKKNMFGSYVSRVTVSQRRMVPGGI